METPDTVAILTETVTELAASNEEQITDRPRLLDPTLKTHSICHDQLMSEYLTVGSEQQPTQKRRLPLWVAITAGAAGLLFGMTFGVAGNSALTRERDALADELGRVTADLDQSQLEMEEMQLSFDDERDALTASVRDAEKSLKATTQLLEKTEKKVAAATERAETAEAEATAAEARATAVEAQVAAAGAHPSFVEQAPQALAFAEPSNSHVYYKNCTAARNAGAAPVYVGQAGYGAHLDRDGDGVGCE